MLKRPVIGFVLIVIFVFLVEGVAFAVDDTVTMDDGIVIYVPPGFQSATFANGVYFANTDAAMKALQESSGDFGVNDYGISLMTSTGLASFGAAPDIDPHDLLGQLLKVLKASGTVEDFPMGLMRDSVNVVKLEASGDAIPNSKATFFSFQMQDGKTVLIVVQGGATVFDQATQILYLVDRTYYEQPQSGAAPASIPTQAVASGGETMTQNQIALNQTFTSDDGLFSVHYPDGWLFSHEDFGYVFASSEAAMKSTSSDGNVPEGEVTVSFLTPNALEQIGVTDDIAPEKALQTVMKALSVSGLIESADVFDVPAASVEVETPAGGNATLYAVSLNNGMVIGIGEAGGDYAEFEAVVIDMINSVRIKNTASDTGESEIVHQWASSASGSSQFGSSSWSFEQATGEPNVSLCGDNGSAWAAASSTGSATLTVKFDRAVAPSQINIYQTFNPGAIIRVDLLSADNGDAIPVADSADKPGNTACPGVYTLDISGVEILVNGVTIYLDQSLVSSWNEIDAVELVGTVEVVSVAAGSKSQWASSASGSSQFGTSSWGFEQATGEPNVTICGDNGKAWAAASSTSSETLALEFADAVIPTQVHIHQSFNPGAITRIELTNTDTGEIIPVMNSADKPGNTPCPGVFTVNISGVETLVNGVIIYFDQSLVSSWNEIDAVELVGNPAS